MSAGYVIAQLKVTNPENYKEYITKVSEVVKKFDGEFPDIGAQEGRIFYCGICEDLGVHQTVPKIKEANSFMVP